MAYIAEKRAMGHVAGVAWSLEEVEDLLLEAGAPLRLRLPRCAEPQPQSASVVDIRIADCGPFFSLKAPAPVGTEREGAANPGGASWDCGETDEP